MDATALRALLMRDDEADVFRVADGVAWLASLTSSPSARPEMVAAVDLLAAGLLGGPMSESRERLTRLVHQLCDAGVLGAA